ncbi:hypothetical protein [Bacillus sp. SM2101]|uniref:hypothetical protein n=1 Tax=Bacillaceae TaxID=186817 RepID=UPI001BDE7CFC|nr:hypothetical protein [Bacillus sp. SM2101]
MKWVRILCGLLVFVLMLCQIAAPVFAYNESSGKVIKFSSKSHVQDRIKVANLPDANVTLLAIKEDKWFKYFQLTVGKRNKEFVHWMNVTDHDFQPKLYSIDVTNTGQEEIIVVLTTDRDKGVYINEAHVLERTLVDKTDVVKEIYIENPRIIAAQKVNMKRTKRGVVLVVDGKSTFIPNNKLDSKEELPQLSMEHFVKFTIEDNTLKAILLVEEKPNHYYGNIVITYEYDNGIMKAEKVELRLG